VLRFGELQGNSNFEVIFEILQSLNSATVGNEGANG
jgi:hypothetical protein